MSPKVYKAFNDIINEHYSGENIDKVLEIGTYHWSLLDIDKFKNSEKTGLNISFSDLEKKMLSGKFTLVEGNTNNLSFADSQFDCVMSCSVFEHDKYFWKSLSEISRVIKKGGLFVVGIPIYMSLKTDIKNTTLTYHRHGLSYNADFYRFSEQAAQEVLLDGYDIKYSKIVRKYPNPYLVIAGIKK
ncbi:MAG: class I SAM-dependent methyltransferase [Candidatus Moranbacteria bacterium]|nr:class I SAM-dependent methyltransferase [Candidatus Moranbacteria bacterium]